MQQQSATNGVTLPTGQDGSQAITHTQPMIITPCTQLVIPQPTKNYDNYATKQSVVLGSIQICCGILSIIFNIVIFGISQRRTPAHSATGIWTGFFFIVAGVFGVVASKQKTKCTIVTFMVLSICCTILGFVLLMVSAIAWGMLDMDCNRDCRDVEESKCYSDCWSVVDACLEDCENAANCTSECWNNKVYTDCTRDNCYGSNHVDECYDVCPNKGYDVCHKGCGGIKALAGMNGLTLCVSLVEIVVSIWSSSICCYTVCCCVSSAYNRAPRIIPIDAHTMQMLQQQVIYIHPGAPGVVMYNPQAANAQGLYQGTTPMPPPYQPPDPNNPGGAGYAVAPPSLNMQAEPLPTKE